MPVDNGIGKDNTKTLDLTTRPEPISEKGLTQFTVGDLHGNTIKLIYTLIRNGVCTLSSEHYQGLVLLYQKNPMSEEDLSNFCKLVDDNLKITNQNILVRLIGDIVADRGQNDLLTLKVLHKLRKGNVPVCITMSNHDDQFMKFFNDSKTFAELKKYTGLSHNMVENQGNSYTNLVQYINACADDTIKQQRFDEVKRMVQESYLPNLVLLDYARSKDNKSITLFSHAPIDLNNIKDVASEFGISWNGIDFKGEPVEKLIAVIDAINQDYQTNLQLGLHSDMMGNIAIKKIAWQRHKEGSSSGSYLPGLIVHNQDPRAGTPSITYVHGHDTPGNLKTAKNTICIDNNIGKGNLKNNGDNCVAYVSNEAISPGPVNQLLTATTIGTEATDNKLRVGYERVLLKYKNEMETLAASRGAGNHSKDSPEVRYEAAAARLKDSIDTIKKKQNTIPTTEIKTTDIAQKPAALDQEVVLKLDEKNDPFFQWDNRPDASPRSVSEFPQEGFYSSGLNDVQSQAAKNVFNNQGGLNPNPSISLTNTTSVAPPATSTINRNNNNNLSEKNTSGVTSVVQPAVTLTPNDHSVSSVNTLAASTAVKHSLLNANDPLLTNSVVTANTFNPKQFPSTDSPIHNTTSNVFSGKEGYTTDETVGDAAPKNLSDSNHLAKTYALLKPLYEAQTNDTISKHFRYLESNPSRYSLIERDFIQSTIALKSVVPLLNNNANVSSVFPTFVPDSVHNDATLIAKAYHASSGSTHAAPERVAVNLVAAKGGVSNITTPNEYEKLATADKNEVAMEMAILYMKECYRPGQTMTIDNGTPEEQARISAALTYLVRMKCVADVRDMDTIQTAETVDTNVENNFTTWLNSKQDQYNDYFKELQKTEPTVSERFREMTNAKPGATAGQSNNLEISPGKPPMVF